MQHTSSSITNPQSPLPQSPRSVPSLTFPLYIPGFPILAIRYHLMINALSTYIFVQHGNRSGGNTTSSNPPPLSRLPRSPRSRRATFTAVPMPCRQSAATLAFCLVDEPLVTTLTARRRHIEGCVTSKMDWDILSVGTTTS